MIDNLVQKRRRALVALHRATRTSELPLGPFIVLGTLAAIAI